MRDILAVTMLQSCPRSTVVLLRLGSDVLIVFSPLLNERAPEYLQRLFITLLIKM
jgi:hypothetical protein